MAFILFLFSGAAACGSAAAALLLYRRLPPAWLCEYGEEPGEAHLAERRCPSAGTAFCLMSAAVCAALTAAWSGTAGMSAADMKSLIYDGLFVVMAAVVLMTAALADSDYCIIPDQMCGAALGMAVIWTPVRWDWPALADTLKGGAVCGGLMLASALIGSLLSGQEGAGAGDVKFLAAAGALAAAAAGPGSWLAASLTVFCGAVLSSAVWFAILLVLKKAEYGDARPLGPWIALSALIVIGYCLRGL